MADKMGGKATAFSSIGDATGTAAGTVISKQQDA